MQNNTPYMICDLDGTISDCTHRLHFINTTPKNWKSFLTLSEIDPPIPTISEYVRMIHASGLRIIYLTARNHEYYDHSYRWLKKHDYPCVDMQEIFMRGLKDHRADVIVKEQIYQEQMLPRFGPAIAGIDDKKSIVDMWNNSGIVGLHVDDQPSLDKFYNELNSRISNHPNN